MRLAFALALLVLASAPVSAQDRFIEACAASPDIQNAEGIDGPALCQCVAESTVARGALPADLDRSVDTPADELSELPDELQAVSALIAESTVSCAAAQFGMGAGDGQMESAGAGSFDPSVSAAATAGLPAGLASALLGEAVEGEMPYGPEAGPVPAAGVPVALPTGLSTGNGRGRVLTEQAGRGSPIRIVG